MNTCAYCDRPGSLYLRELQGEEGPVRLCDGHLYAIKARQGTSTFRYLPAALDDTGKPFAYDTEPLPAL